MLSNDIRAYEKLIDECNGCFLEKSVEKEKLVIDKMVYGEGGDILDEALRKFSGNNRITHRVIGSHLYSISEKYLLLICEDEELGKEEKKRINYLKQKDVKVFILIVFSDRIFLSTYDVSGIPTMRESALDCTGFPAAVSVRKNVVKNLEEYIKMICFIMDFESSIIRLKKEKETYETWMEELADLLNHSKFEEWEQIYLSWETEIYVKNIKQADAYIERCQNALDELKSQYQTYADQCNNELVEKRFHKVHVGNFTADLLCHYGDIQERIYSYLQKCLQSNRFARGSLYMNGINECIAELERKTAVAFVGTFSSGKTSFINWLVDMDGEQQFRTSGGHNTAILTYIKGTSNEECIEVHYKQGEELFDWTLFSVDEDERLADRYEGENGVVVSIDHKARLIVLKEMEKTINYVLKNQYDEIIVKRGQRIEKGAFLTKGFRSELEIPNDKRNVNLRSIEEYRNIIEAIKSKKLERSELILSCVESDRHKQIMKVIRMTGIQEIQSLINRLMKLEEKIQCKNIRMDQIPNEFWNIRGLPRNIRFTKVKIKAKCNMQDRQEKLTPDMWKRYCGNGSDHDKVVSEKPEGYLYTKDITFYLNKGFLEYSDIVDTPGLGSLSEEHDAITESYIRGTTDNLLVMIKIDKNAKSIEKRKFISEIADIFEKSKRGKGNVFFVCNLWSSQITREEQRNIFKKYCDEYHDMIVSYGFDEKHFYVIDIKKMQMGNREEHIFGYSSDVIFKQEFLKHIANAGIQNSLSKINEDIIPLFKNNIRTYEDLIKKYNEDILGRETKIYKYKSACVNLNRVEMESFERLFQRENDVYEQLQYLQNEIRLTTSYGEWMKLLEGSIFDDISGMQKLLYELDDEGYSSVRDGLVDEYLLRAKRVVRIWENAVEQEMESVFSHDISHVTRIGISKFPFSKLKDMLNKQKSGFYGKVHFIKNSHISKQGAEDISEFIENQLVICREENWVNYKALKEKLRRLKVMLSDDLEQKMDDLSHADTAGVEKDYIAKINELKENMEKWETDIVPQLKKVGVYIG